ncbi:uncharacterized protein F4807DRAFT_303987 [Annulohypoxylon truncatum]|uniref:uncharacterized protein n=1 Tax=Annulohypoxylon truncatum TaxID=327061 RepID=UPI0020073F1F|nr:uncharacterized protein F4807DRAFT_303987 [Annulohypoxylon truncatum]KAI1212898.1 hypothetical protein F4807DRAFT_303987 [Annulohypoxylon truncatum]
MKRKADEPAEGDLNDPKASRTGRIQDVANRDRVNNITNITNDHKNDDGARDDESATNDGVSNFGTLSEVATPATEVTEDQPSTPQPKTGRKKYPSDLKLHKCTWDNCKAEFNRPCRLQDHIRKQHTGERPYVCGQCGHDFANKKNYEDHRKGHENKRDHVCPHEGCVQDFTTRAKLKRHMATHEKNDPLTCHGFPPCSQVFRKQETLDRHIRTVHHNAAGFVCNRLDDRKGTLCEVSFDNAASLRRHKEQQHGPLNFWCDECQQVGNNVGFPTIAQLNEHIRQNHPKHKCPFCELLFANISELEQHVDSHPKKNMEERKTVPCTWPGCGNMFTRKSNMAAHVKSCHEGRRFVCGEFDVSGTKDLADWPLSDGCKSLFSTKGNLENHIRYVHLKVPRPEQAQGQAKAKQPSSNLLGQLAGAGAAPRQTLRCRVPGCSAKFTHNGELGEHLQTTHLLDPSDAQNLQQQWSASPNAMRQQLPTLFNNTMPQQQSFAPYTNPTLQQQPMYHGSAMQGSEDSMDFGQGDTPLYGEASPHVGFYGGQAPSNQVPGGGDLFGNATQPGNHEFWNEGGNQSMGQTYYQPQNQGEGNFQAGNLASVQ